MAEVAFSGEHGACVDLELARQTGNHGDTGVVELCEERDVPDALGADCHRVNLTGITVTIRFLNGEKLAGVWPSQLEANRRLKRMSSG